MEKLYLSGVALNNCKGLNELYNIIKKEGGYIVSDWQEKIKPTYIYNYHDNDKLEIKTYFISYIHFVLDGYLYYIQLNDNPFFLGKFSKIQINQKGEASKDVYLDELDAVYFDYNMTKEEIKESALKLYEYLAKAKPSKKYVERTKKRVPNIYNDGWHWEHVAKPERMSVYKKVGFVEAQTMTKVEFKETKSGICTFFFDNKMYQYLGVNGLREAKREARNFFDLKGVDIKLEKLTYYYLSFVSCGACYTRCFLTKKDRESFKKNIGGNLSVASEWEA